MNRSPQEKLQLREKFMDEVYKHLGVPYRRANHPEGSALRNYAYELDCCALVRVSIQSLESQLGFKLGLWN